MNPSLRQTCRVTRGTCKALALSAAVILLTAEARGITLRLDSAADLVRNGNTWILETPTAALRGIVDAPADVASLIFGSTETNFDSGSGSWTGVATLTSGLNVVTIEALDAQGNVLESATVEIIHVPPANHLSGQLAESTTWSGAYLLGGVFVVPAGLTLAMEAGSVILMKEGATLQVNGQLLARGTKGAPIHFTHYGEETTWGRLMFVQAENSLLRHCVIEYADCEGDHKDYYDDDCEATTPPPSRTYFQAVVAIASHLDIDHCLFQNLPHGSRNAQGDAIAIISDDPDLPGAATANIRGSQFIGIGQGIHTRFSYVLVQDCFFTAHNGDNDHVDLYGESDPPPLIRNNVMINPDQGDMFNPSSDDMINPTRCSAILIGNIIAGSSDYGVVLRDKCSPVLINNLIYNCSTAGVAVQNQCDALLINNTIVNCGRGVRLSDHINRWDAPYCLYPGSGKATLINCIIWDCPTPLALADSPYDEESGSHLSVSYCNVGGGLAASSVSVNSTLTWGQGNIASAPRFVDPAGSDYRLRSAAGRWDPNGKTWAADLVTSPCIDAGTDVLAIYPELAPWLAQDYDALPRPLDGAADGRIAFDIGAHEVIVETADSNGDTIPDGWYHRYGLNPRSPTVASANPDGDSATTFAEWLADTHPTDPKSSFRITGVSLESGRAQVSFPSSANRTYSLLSSADLVNWSPVPDPDEEAGTGGIVTLTDPNGGTKKFYHVRVSAP